MKTQMVSAVFLTTALAVSMPPSLESSATPSAENSSPTLINTCLITNDVKRLTSFYSQALEMEPHKVDDNYVEFRTGTAVLAIFAAEAQEKYIPGSAKAGQNNSAILQFKVGDVDQEYARLQGLVKTWVKKPTTQPWGTRSIYFRDPDGNLVDFFVPVTHSELRR
jgi:catechol 2,3-dioxygenase-like lactoylglutathione lyase family enzyme